MPRDDEHHTPGTSKKTLTIIVNGVSTEVERNMNAPLRSVIERALEQTGNVGQAPENWELRDASGTPLDITRKIEDLGFPDGTVLYLSLKAGVGGC
ncbi:MAG: DUF2604 domain-containing protein [Gemmatimonadaceae bacterium]